MINETGLILSKASKVTNNKDVMDFPMQVIPDGKGPWALRYIWVQHSDNNEEFIANYFNKGNNSDGKPGMNLRKQTTFMQETAWNPHNDIFEKSRDSGNLVWRVKAANPNNASIDYIEIWRTKKTIREAFSPKLGTINPALHAFASDSEVARPAEAIEKLREGLQESGFVSRINLVFPEVNPLQAMRWYMYFVGRRDRGESCVINTPYNKELNPWKCWLPQDDPNYEPSDRSFYEEWWRNKKKDMEEKRSKTQPQSDDTSISNDML